jgi:hypothetical protein
MLSPTTQHYKILSAVADSSKRDIKKMLFFKRSWQQCSKFLMLLAISLNAACGQQRLKFLTAVADSV